MLAIAGRVPILLLLPAGPVHLDFAPPPPYFLRRRFLSHAFPFLGRELSVAPSYLAAAVRRALIVGCYSKTGAIEMLIAGMAPLGVDRDNLHRKGKAAARASCVKCAPFIFFFSPL